MNNLFAYNLKNYRKKNKLTLSELSDKLQISRTALSGYEKGLNEPNLYTLFKIATLMNCSLDDLVGISNPQTKLESIPIPTEPSKDEYIDELKNSISLLNSLIEKNRRTFEDLSKSQKRSKLLIDELTMSKKRNDRLFDELTMSKKRNDLTFKELERTINRLSKTEELFKDVSTELLDLINSSKNLDIEIADEISPNIIKFPEKEHITYRNINIVGKVSAGNPCYASEAIEDIVKIPSKYLCDSKNYFALEVTGDSMNKIFKNGTLVLIEQGNFAPNYSIVIAITNNEEATIKKLKINKHTIDLIPESTNPKHQIQTYPKGEIAVLGTVLGPLDNFLDL